MLGSRFIYQRLNFVYIYIYRVSQYISIYIYVVLNFPVYRWTFEYVFLGSQTKKC